MKPGQDRGHRGLGPVLRRLREPEYRAFACEAVDRGGLHAGLGIEGPELVRPQRVDDQHDDVLRRLEGASRRLRHQDTRRAPRKAPRALPFGPEVEANGLSCESCEVDLVLGPLRSGGSFQNDDARLAVSAHLDGERCAPLPFDPDRKAERGLFRDREVIPKRRAS